MTDIDLLLPAGSIRQAGLLLEQAGLRHLEDEQRAARRTAFQTPGRATVPVEVHWDLSQRHRFRPDLEGIWRRSLPFELEGFAVRRLAPADEFVYLALHYAAHYFGLTLKWLVDLRELLRRNPPDLEEIAARAGEWRGRAGVHFALRYLGKVYPDLDDAGGSRRRLSQPLRDILIRPWLSEDPLLLVSSKERGPFRLLLGLLLVDRPADMLRLGWATLLSPDPEHDPPRAPDPRRVRTGSP